MSLKTFWVFFGRLGRTEIRSYTFCAFMSQLLIQQYLNELSDLRRASGTARETVVREAFKTLLKDIGKSHDLIFVPEYEYETLQKQRVYPDGALLYPLRVPLGYWEAKDEDDDLDKEIEKKFRKGYPQDNIIFEDSNEAVLIQNKHEVIRCGVQDGIAGAITGGGGGTRRLRFFICGFPLTRQRR
jgi:hypothetical protein